MSATQADPIASLALEQLSTALLSDAMDELGLIHQVMESSIRPLDDATTLCGRARTGSYRDTYHAEHDPDPYAAQVTLVDSLQPGEVVVLACGRSGRIQPWGEVFAVAAQMRGSAGCVLDGLLRDVRQIRARGFPAFSAGYGAMEVRGRGVLTATDVPVHCGGVWVSPGDLVFGDADGVVVVPRNAEEEVTRSAVEKAAVEREILRALREGARISDLYRRYGTL
jgi:4-hydroxy-4-methyl-2-oxoglutarate aldolase